MWTVVALERQDLLKDNLFKGFILLNNMDIKRIIDTGILALEALVLTTPVTNVVGPKLT